MNSKRWYDSKALWTLAGIGAVVLCDIYGISGEAKLQILALIATKIGSQAWSDIKQTPNQ